MKKIFPVWATYFRKLSLIVVLLFSFLIGNSQVADCPYPIIVLHGWTGNQTSFSSTYTDANWQYVFGTLQDNGATTDHVFHAMLNASTSTNFSGNDGILGTSDDDALVTFNNETNDLLPGCVYATNFDNAWNEDPSNPIIYHNDGSAIALDESDSNESAIKKQGYALGRMIEKVLAANPGKEKVILIGHSMGGLAIREYLQRNEGGSHIWWVDPSSADGHKVAIAATTSTPHLGSNTMGNISLTGNNDDTKSKKPKGDEGTTKDGLPDLNSEAVRDLRYSWSCGLLGLSNCKAAYLYGGEEDAGWGWWNEDVDCNGSQINNNIVGINIDGTVQGVGDAWDGTYDNPAMPLPNNIHYTWQVSPSDGVVSDWRQWPHNGNTPYPTDGVVGRLADTTIVDRFHTNVNDYADEVIRNLDEGDYPFFAFGVNMDINYICMPNYRPHNAAEWTPRDDPDWYSFQIPAGFADDLRIGINTNTGVATTLDYFPSNPGDYTSMTTAGNMTLNIPEGGSFAATELIVPNAQLNIGGTNYIRINHANTIGTDWRTPTTFILEAIAALPVEWLSFEGKLQKEQVHLDWAAVEINTRQYDIERSHNGVQFEKIGEQNAKNIAAQAQDYTFVDAQPRYGMNYYRLRSIDFDGHTQYSEIISIDYQKVHFDVLRAYPNPTADLALTEIYAPQNEDINLLIVNQLGQVIQQKNKALEMGYQTLYLDLSDFPSGVYTAILEGNQHRQEVRLVKR